MSVDKINQLVNSIAKIVESSEKIAVPVISVKLQKIAESNPYDQTIVGMANVISKMADNNKIFLSREDFRKLYNKFYTRNTKFAQYFADELGSGTPLKTPVMAEATQKPIEKTHEHFADPILTDALNAAWDNKVSVSNFDVENAKKAKYVVSSNLDVWNLKASQLDVKAGNEHFIVVQANYNTPKGVTSILVPVEINKGKALEPAVFMANAGPQELNHVNIKNYLTSFAGAKLKVRAEDVVGVLTKEISGKKAVNSVELAATKIAAAKERGGTLGGIIGQKVEEVNKNFEVNLPKVAESNSFAEKFATPTGIADFKFGKEKIDLGRDVILRSLSGFGFKNPQITVVSCDDNTIFYGVSLFGGQTAFKVPVKVANNKVLNPDIIICNSAVTSFSKNSINNLSIDGTTDAKMAAATSPQYGLKPSDLVENVRKSIAEGNYAKAEDALNILQQSGDSVAYKAAFVSYINGMNMHKKTASEEIKCSMIVKSATSSHELCGHTNLPLHKVYQDQHGNCHPLYRKGLDESYQGAYFMNSKIFG